jgi:hypothetical protein
MGPLLSSRQASAAGSGRPFDRTRRGYEWCVSRLTSYRRRSRAIAGFHSAYLVTTGVWPLLHRDSFEAVTGPKNDFWLVRIVGGLAAACGVALGASVIRDRPSPEIQLLASAQALVFISADMFAASTQSRVYLGDVVLQAACVPAWFLRWTAGS